MQELSAPGMPPPKDYIIALTGASTFPATFGDGGNAGVAASTAANPRFPTWMRVVGAGTNVWVNEDGTSTTLVCIGGETLVGTFESVTSMGSAGLILGIGDPPPPPPALATAVGTSIVDAGGFTDETDVEGALQEIYQDLRSTLGIIVLSPQAFYLATGAPLAIFADGASAVPGSSLTNSKVFCVRWNNHAAPDAVLTSFHMPPDCDITANMVAHVKASKTGATVGDATTFDIACFNQVVGALHDADADFGGATSAMVGDATAKTVQDVTRTLALANLAAHPASVTLTIRPTAATLGTDDLCMEEVYILYTKKPLAS